MMKIITQSGANNANTDLRSIATGGKNVQHVKDGFVRDASHCRCMAEVEKHNEIVADVTLRVWKTTELIPLPCLKEKSKEEMARANQTMLAAKAKQRAAMVFGAMRWSCARSLTPIVPSPMWMFRQRRKARCVRRCLRTSRTPSAHVASSTPITWPSWRLCRRPTVALWRAGVGR